MHASHQIVNGVVFSFCYFLRYCRNTVQRASAGAAVTDKMAVACINVLGTQITLIIAARTFDLVAPTRIEDLFNHSIF